MNNDNINKKYGSHREYLKYKFLYRSRIGTLLLTATSKNKKKTEKIEADHKKHKTTKKHINKHDDIYSITREYFLMIKEYLSSRDVPLFVLAIPDNRKSTGKLTKSKNYLKAISLLQELSIPYLDPFDHLTKDDYWDVKEHWNNSGHFKTFILLKRHLNVVSFSWRCRTRLL